MAITILQWNAGGLTTKFRELKQLATTKGYDIICIQETFYKSTHKAQWNIPGYSTVRQDRPPQKKRGGLCIYVKHSLKYSPLTCPTNIECQEIEIITKTGRLGIINVYLPPGGAMNDEDINAFKSLLIRQKAVITGDLNAKNKMWHSPVNDTRGKQLAEEILQSDFVTINGHQPTRLGHTGTTSHIDVSLVTNNLALKCKWTTLNGSMGSDHQPIQVTINEAMDRNRAAVPRWNLTKADWKAYESICTKQLTLENTSDEDVDKFNDKLTNAIITAAENTIPQTGLHSSKRPHPLPYWNEEIKAAIYARNRARNVLAKTKNIDNGIEYKRLKAAAQRKIRQTAVQYWRDYCTTLNKNSNLSTVWKRAKAMNGTRSSTTSKPLNEGGTSVSSDGHKADLFAKQFAKVSSSENHSADFKKHKADLEENRADMFTNKAHETAASQELNIIFTRDELNLAITRLTKGKSPGQDRILPDFLIHLPDSAKQVLLNFYNKIWNDGHIPKKWKNAIVVPILKPGKDETNAESYRPIALTSAVCKLMERLVANRLSWYLESNGLLTNNQSGFRRHHGTIDPIMRLQDTVLRHLANSEYVLVVFIDLAKAFDMVWTGGLIHKLKKHGVNGHMLDWFRDFMSNRTIQVRVGSELSSKTALENGTPQGAMISPSSFNVMINDLPDAVATANERNAVNTSLFADDTTLETHGSNVTLLLQKMQRALDAAQKWCDTWGFEISTNKTIAILFENGNVKRNNMELTLRGQKIRFEDSAKFLGVTFDRKLTWKQHVNNTVDKCRKRLTLMKSLKGTTWGADRSSLLTIYRSLIRPIMDYGAIAFDSASQTTLLKLTRIQTTALRIASGAMPGTATAALQVECGEMPLHLRRLSQQMKHAVKITSKSGHPNESLLAEHWTTAYGRYRDGREPIAFKVKELLQQIKEKTWSPTPGDIAPWKIRRPKIDIELTKEVSKHDSPFALAVIGRCKIAEYQDHLQIYTDASLTPDGTVGIGVVITQAEKLGSVIELAARITDDCAIYTGELAAIRLAIELVTRMQQGHEKAERIAIFSDSLSVITSFHTGGSNSRPNMFCETSQALSNLQADITLVWIPSHVGIQGNETADRLANKGREHSQVNCKVDWELAEAYTFIHRHIANKWQTTWNTETTGTQYRQLVPKIHNRPKLQLAAAWQERLITRLRLGKCSLNAYMRQTDGKCHLCQAQEDIKHYVIDCKLGEVAKAVRYKCQQLRIEPTIQNVLSNKMVLQTICGASRRRL